MELAIPVTLDSSSDPSRRHSFLLSFSPKHTPRESTEEGQCHSEALWRGASGVGGIIRTRPSHSSPRLRLVLTQMNRPHSILCMRTHTHTQIDTNKTRRYSYKKKLQNNYICLYCIDGPTAPLLPLHPSAYSPVLQSSTHPSMGRPVPS